MVRFWRDITRGWRIDSNIFKTSGPYRTYSVPSPFHTRLGIRTELPIPECRFHARLGRRQDAVSLFSNPGPGPEWHSSRQHTMSSNTERLMPRDSLDSGGHLGSQSWPLETHCKAGKLLAQVLLIPHAPRTV
jgi:hypothetical protein